MSLIFLIVGLGIGLPIGWLIFKVKSNSAVPQSEDLKIQLKLELERSKKLGEELQQINDELRREREEVLHLNNQQSTLTVKPCAPFTPFGP